MSKVGRRNDVQHSLDARCHHIDCVCDEPKRLVTRSLKGVDHTAEYCYDHDPLNGPNAALWERVE